MKFIPFCYFKLLTEQEQGSVLLIVQKTKTFFYFRTVLNEYLSF